MSEETPEFIYHLARAGEWERARDGGVYRGSDQDRADGFLHFSTAAEIAESAARHRAGEAGLLLLKVRTSELGPALRWEPSRGGQLFPHLYGELAINAVARVDPLPVDEEGRHRFPDLE